MGDIINARKPTTRTTTMKAIADLAHRGLPPESELRVYEFGNGTVQKKSGEYKGVWNDDAQAWE
jgi:hypothetical protein